MASRDHGWWPYLAPYGLFFVLIELGRRVPESLEPALFVLKVAVPGGLILWFASRGRLPELRGYRLDAGVLADVAVGLGITALWLGPFLLFPTLPRGEAGLDRSLLGAEATTLAVRFVGFAIVTPFMEELFVRSLLHRYIEVYRDGRDFRTLPIGTFHGTALIVTTVWFTLSHVPWEWIVAFPSALAFTGWLYVRKHIGATIVAHAVTNGSIFALVVWGPFALDPFL